MTSFGILLKQVIYTILLIIGILLFFYCVTCRKDECESFPKIDSEEVRNDFISRLIDNYCEIDCIEVDYHKYVEDIYSDEAACIIDLLIDFRLNHLELESRIFKSRSDLEDYLSDLSEDTVRETDCFDKVDYSRSNLFYVKSVIFGDSVSGAHRILGGKETIYLYHIFLDSCHYKYEASTAKDIGVDGGCFYSIPKQYTKLIENNIETMIY